MSQRSKSSSESVTGHDATDSMVEVHQNETKKISGFLRNPRSFIGEFWSTRIKRNENGILQIGVALSIVLVNIYIGYTHVNDLMVNGWQLWSWLASIILCGIVLVTPRKFHVDWKRNVLPMVGLLALAFIPRLLFLSTIPEGIHGDESGTINFTMLHVFPRFEQTLNPFITGFNSQPSIHSYIIRLFFWIGGYNIAAFRLSSVIVGAFAVLATFFMVAIAHNRRAAWFAASFMAVYQYHVQWSRIGLNNVWATLLIPLTLAFFLWGWREKWNGGAVFSGIALGFVAYFYQGGAVVVILMIFVVLDLWFRNKSRDERYRLILYAGKTIALAAVVAGPLLVFAALKPDYFFSRTHDGFAWIPQTIREATGSETAYIRFFFHQLVRSFGMFVANADGSGFYAPGIPFLIGLAAPLTFLGLGWSIYKKNFLMLVWFLSVTLLVGILTYAGSAHLIAAIPVICWAIGAGLNWLSEKGWKNLVILMFIILVATELTFYFYVYPAIPRGDMNLPLPPLS